MSHRLARAVLCLLSFALPMGLTGCLRIAPKMPPNLASPAPITYSGDAFQVDVNAYRASVAAGQLDAAKTQRNQIIFRVMAQIDMAYDAFEAQLSTQRAGVQTAGDAAQLGLSAAATVVGASAVKDILSATSTALQGTRISFDKNFFEQKTTAALISEMRASRKTLKSQLLLSLSTRDIAGYPLEAAWIDLVNYYYAGTVSSALVDIASKAGSDELVADSKLKDTVRSLTPATPEQARNAKTLGDTYARLYAGVKSGEPRRVGHAATLLRQILTGAGISFDASASADDLLDAMRLAMLAARDNDDKLAKLNSAVRAVPEP